MLPISEYFEVNPSNIVHGEDGLFAKKDIPKNTLMFLAFIKNPNIDTKVWEYQFKQTNIMSKVNHSETPNTKKLFSQKLQRMFISASRNIKRGEEITCNYQHTIDFAKRKGYTFFHNLLWFKK